MILSTTFTNRNILLERLCTITLPHIVLGPYLFVFQFASLGHHIVWKVLLNVCELRAQVLVHATYRSHTLCVAIAMHIFNTRIGSHWAVATQQEETRKRRIHLQHNGQMAIDKVLDCRCSAPRAWEVFSHPCYSSENLAVKVRPTRSSH